MKIGQLDNSPKPQKVASPAADARANQTAAAKDTSAAPAEASATVELSPAAAALAAQGNAGDFDADKVARIAQAIREGKFEVNAEAIADKLIAHTRDLLSSRQ
jgi:negative regulator of flagellin synthesis FlgM